MKRYFEVRSGTAPIYADPNFDSQCVNEALKGEFCKIISTKNDWLKIILDDGYKGWTHQFYGKKENIKKTYPFKIIYPFKDNLFRPDYPFGSYVDKRINGAVDINSSFSSDDLNIILKNLLDIPYKWGGRSSLGFDCSGLVQSVLNSLGYNIPRDSCDQFKFFMDYKIDIKDAQYGDLHFFGKRGKVNHVAFSSGGTGIIHSQGYVKKETLDVKNKYFNKRLLDNYLSTHSIRLKFEK